MKIMFPITGKPVKLSQNDQNDLVMESVKSWKAYDNQWSGWLELARESVNLYSDNRPGPQVRESSNEPVRANVRLPIIAQAVDSVVSQQHLANFPQDELFFKLRPKNEAAKGMKAALEQHLEDSFEQLDFMAMAQKDRKALSMTGCVVTWHPWVVCKDKRYTYEQPEVLGIPVGSVKRKEVEVTTFEGTAFIPLHWEDVRFDATADTIRDTNVIFRRWMDVEDLKEVEGLQNKRDIDAYSNVHDDSSSRKADYYKDWGIDPLIADKHSIRRLEKCLLYEEWGDFHIGGKCYENYVLIYSNERIFHYFGPNDFDHRQKPMTICPYVFMPNSLLGKSMTHDIIPMAHTADTIANQVLDNASMNINAAYTVNYKDPVIQEQIKKQGTINTAPGAIILVADHDSVRPLVHDRGTNADGLSLYQVIKEEIRESSGGVPYTTGGASSADQERTLGEVEILASGTSTRFQMINQTYDEMRLKPYIRQCVSNLRQFMTEAIIPIDEKIITAENIKMAEFDVDVTGSKSVMTRKKDFDDMMFVMEKLIPAMIERGYAVPDGSIMKVNIPGAANQLIQLTSAKNLPELFEVKTPDDMEQEQPDAETEGLVNGLAAISEAAGGGPQTGLVGPGQMPGMAVAPPQSY